MKRRNFFKLAGISAVSTMIPNAFAHETKENVSINFENKGSIASYRITALQVAMATWMCQHV